MLKIAFSGLFYRLHFTFFFVFSKEWKPCTNCKTACSECNALADGTFSDVDAQWGISLLKVAFASRGGYDYTANIFKVIFTVFKCV